MKIDTMQSHIVAVPPPHIGGMYWIFVTLQTRCGIQGVGEVYASTFHPEVMVKVLDDVFDRYLKGHDPHHIEIASHPFYAFGSTVVKSVGGQF